MREKLTKRVVDAVQSATSDVWVWDTELAGFGLKVTPLGRKTFVLQFYAPGQHRVTRRLVLGRYGGLTVDEARAAARARLAEIAKGNDSMREKAEARRQAREDTVEKLFEEYLEDGVGKKSIRTLELYEQMGRMHVLPAIGRLPVNQVTARHVADLHRDMRDRPTTANRVVRLVRSFFYWLARPSVARFSGANPAKHIDWFPERTRERFLTVEEMGRLGQALRVAETVGLPPAPQHRKPVQAKRARNTGMFSSDAQIANPVAVAAIRFLMFTGWREQEALTLQWSFVDFERGTITLPSTKSGKSVRSLAAPARQLLSEQPRVAGSPFVFPGRDPDKPLRELQRLWYAVRSEARLEDVRLHDLRHSVASFAGGRGYSMFLIGKLLGHRDSRSTERYAHLADDVRQTMADDVGEVIRDALASDPTTAHLVTTPVRALRARR